jgi:hypothetical protein
VTVGLSALALVWARGAPSVVQAAARAPNEPASNQTQPLNSKVTATLPTDLPSWQIEPARRDIFSPVLPPLPPPPKPLPVVMLPIVNTVVIPVVVPNPAAPAISLRYLGTMVTPQGQRLVMLARGDTAVTVQEGTRLDEGYVVQAIGQDEVRLLYPATGMVLGVPIPATPSDSR